MKGSVDLCITINSNNNVASCRIRCKHGCCTHKMGKDTIHPSVGNQSLYSRPHYVEAAVIIAVILAQFRKSECSTEVPVQRTMRPCQEQRGNVSDVYLHPPCQLPAFMPRPCLSSIVRTQCYYSSYRRPSERREQTAAAEV